MRVALTLALLALLATAVAVQPASSKELAAPAFGSGDVAFQEIEVPGDSSAEPTIGIPWNTDSLFFYPSSNDAASATEGMRVLRGTFDDAGTATWDDVTPPYLIPLNLDPMLVADPDTGRVFAGGLLGPCSSMMYTDDDGETWLPTINMCSGKDFDHQSIGLGPPAGPIPSPEGSHIGYYCAQLGTISCARSLDQGSTWGPFQVIETQCGGFHGHIRVSPMTGFAVVPVASCGDHSGYLATADGGLTWAAHEVPESAPWTNGFDPSVQFSRPGGWMYFGMASEHGVYMGLSKDEGATWEPIGGGMGVEPATWLDVGQFHDPPIVSGVFTNIQTGDDERVAISFIGLEGPDGADLGLLKSKGIYRCNAYQEQLVWHYYVATSYDAGETWAVNKLTTDPVQVGGIYDSVVDGGGGCRNLLDFQDMDIDSTGRMHIGWADGCTQECASTATTNTTGYRDTAPRLLRQIGGNGLFKEFDTAPPVAIVPNEPAESASEQESPAAGMLLLVAALAALAVARRRA